MSPSLLTKSCHYMATFRLSSRGPSRPHCKKKDPPQKKNKNTLRIELLLLTGSCSHNAKRNYQQLRNCNIMPYTPVFNGLKQKTLKFNLLRVRVGSLWTLLVNSWGTLVLA